MTVDDSIKRGKNAAESLIRAEKLEEFLKLRSAGAKDEDGSDAENEDDDERSARKPVVSKEGSTEEALAAAKLRQINLKLKQRKQDIRMRRNLARWTTGIVVGQVFVANLFFGFYILNNAKDPEPVIMVAWLSATVVEVVGILWVIARSLFPNRDKNLGQNGRTDTTAGS